MNAAMKVLGAILPAPSWELIGAVATFLAMSFTVCFLGMIAQMLAQDAPPPLAEAPEGEALQEVNGARVLRRRV